MADLDSNPKSIQSLYSWYAAGKLWVNRRYQRKLVWTLIEKQKLVESILKGYPVPAILLAERENGDYEVIDGLQRLHTLMSFIETAFSVDGKRYFDVSQFPTANTRVSEGIFAIEPSVSDHLTPREVGVYLDYSMAVSIMRGATDEEIDEVFSRINTYGHQLSDQERRQAGMRKGFPQPVRSLSSYIREDLTEEILPLANMPDISIDTPMAKHGYSIAASNVFWVEQGILRSTDLRDSMDEQCIADIAACIIGGKLIARSKDALDEIYSEDSTESRRIDAALAGHGSERFTAEFNHVYDQIRQVCGRGKGIKLRNLLFSKKRTTNPFPAVFVALFIAFYELLITEKRMISDYDGIVVSLNNLDERLRTSKASTTSDERRGNVNTIKGQLSAHMVEAKHRNLYDDQTAADVDIAIRRSQTEAPHFELKQGILRLDEARAIDDGILQKLIRTACAMANNGAGRSGVILLGVADKPTDARRIARMYGTSPRVVNGRSVVGVRREAEHLGETLEQYFSRIKQAFNGSALSEPLKSGVLASLTYTDYFGLGVVAINIPTQREVSTLGAQVFVRSGDDTIEAVGADILNVSKRF